MPTNKNPPYRFLPFLSMLYMTIMLSGAVLSNKIISLAGHISMAGTLFVPLWFILSDIITEIYGYKIARQIVWLAFICHFIFALLCAIAIKTPSPDFWHGQAGYELVLGHLIKVTVSAFIAYIISGTLNIYLLAKWKVLLKGKYFWLRSLGASTIGELIYTVLAVILIQYHVLTFDQIWRIILTSYSIKIIFSLISAFPANMIVFLLKRTEQIPDQQEHLDPFKKRAPSSLKV